MEIGELLPCTPVVVPIMNYPHPALLAKADPVEEADFSNPLLQFFVNCMHLTMQQSRGIGLAANQVNLLTRIIVLHIPWKEGPKEWWHDTNFSLINPEVVEKKGKIRWNEGCLSFPRSYGYVDRAAEITVQARNPDGTPLELKATGLFSVCLQHEIDHLDGIVFTSRMSRLQANLIKKKMQK